MFESASSAVRAETVSSERTKSASCRVFMRSSEAGSIPVRPSASISPRMRSSSWVRSTPGAAVAVIAKRPASSAERCDTKTSRASTSSTISARSITEDLF